MLCFGLTATQVQMRFVLQPWQLLAAILAGWVNREQQQYIEYLRTENQILKERLGKKRILLNDDQRRDRCVVRRSFSIRRVRQLSRSQPS